MISEITQNDILQGVDVSEVGGLAKRFSVNKEEMASILGVSPRTLQKKSAGHDQSLDKNLSERCLNLNNLMNIAIDYFGSKEGAVDWFHTENRSLGSVTPFSLCDTFLGMQRVEEVIVKLMYGMTA